MGSVSFDETPGDPLHYGPTNSIEYRARVGLRREFGSQRRALKFITFIEDSLSINYYCRDSLSTALEKLPFQKIRSGTSSRVIFSARSVSCIREGVEPTREIFDTHGNKFGSGFGVNPLRSDVIFGDRRRIARKVAHRVS